MEVHPHLVQGADAVSADQKLFCQGEEAAAADDDDVEGRSHLQTSNYIMTVHSTVLNMGYITNLHGHKWSSQLYATSVAISFT